LTLFQTAALMITVKSSTDINHTDPQALRIYLFTVKRIL
jgi:hypothetical protein